MIRKHIVPRLISRRFIHIWDAGCAMGPEPYSLAITLRENMGKMIFRNVKIHATDIDNSNLFKKIIQNGVYPVEQLRRIPHDIFTKYFEPAEQPDYFIITEDIRKCIEFKKHDLLTLQPVRKDNILIVCKNVLLHFSEKERIDVISMFHESLEKDGFFVIEQTQKIPAELEGMFERVVPNAQVFRRVN
ncbi:MAG: chemotaxis protein CheR [ANME-2 cluster archaeon]|nr:chemotaxis protein CheR [ANME-2 cluster archaeon]